MMSLIGVLRAAFIKLDMQLSCQTRFSHSFLSEIKIKNKKPHAELVVLKIAQSELAAHQKKMFLVDNSIVISVAGLTADARCYVILCARGVWVPDLYLTDLFLCLFLCL